MIVFQFKDSPDSHDVLSNFTMTSRDRFFQKSKTLNLICAKSIYVYYFVIFQWHLRNMIFASVAYCNLL